LSLQNKIKDPTLREKTTMADQTFRTADQAGFSSSPGLDKATTAGKSVADQAISASREIKEKAMDVASASAETIKGQASDFVDAAKDVASQATDKLKQTVEGQKTAGADYVGSLANTIRRAASEFDDDLPIAGTYIRKAASQVEGVADKLRTGNFSDLVQGAQSFARRQPTAFLGLAVLAGFGAVRFLKSSADNAEFSGSQQAGGVRYSGSGANRSHDTGYRDEFTK
jgi:hypothetical protein